MTERPKGYWLNFTLCAGGVLVFILFVLGLERSDSFSNIIIEVLRANDIAVVGGLTLLCIAVCVPFALKEMNKGKEKDQRSE